MTISTDRFRKQDEPTTSRQYDAPAPTDQHEPESPFRVSVELHGEAWNEMDQVL